MKMFLVLLLVFPLSCISVPVIVDTSRGSVHGFDHDFGNDTSKRFFGYGQVFLGIPFAKPPVGDRRFKLPEGICRYNDRGEVHNATYYRPRCWQTNKNNVDENCLYLNVITPHAQGSFPVMVHIHGGRFATGGADSFHWKGAIRNLVSRGVVVVTIQYRLGFLGFFTTFTERFPPNRGMYDQILALRWVNEEIANFGGDASRITIFGQSAGAISVSDLSMSPLAQGLFHQLIQSSGSAMNQLDSIENPIGSIHQTRAHQICGFNSTDWGSPRKDQLLLECLTKASPQELIASDFSEDGFTWGVAIDGAFMPEYPENLAESRPRYPVLMGDMLEDYALFIPGVAVGGISNITSHTHHDFIRTSMTYVDLATRKNFSDTMVASYTDGVIPPDDDHMAWTRLITDMMTGITFSSLLLRDAQWHQKAGNEDVWLFTFAHSSLLHFNIDIDGWIPVGHGSELPFLWFYPVKWHEYNATESDLAVANYMGGMWAYFARHGELPFPRASETMNYIEIGDSLTIKRNWQQKADDVFNHQIPTYYVEFPPQRLSDKALINMRDLGKKIVSQWNSMKCPTTVTSAKSMTRNTNSSSSMMTFAVIILGLWNQ